LSWSGAIAEVDVLPVLVGDAEWRSNGHGQSIKRRADDSAGILSRILRCRDGALVLEPPEGCGMHVADAILLVDQKHKNGYCVHFHLGGHGRTYRRSGDILKLNVSLRRWPRRLLLRLK
jgi:hypothetical protein